MTRIVCRSLLLSFMVFLSIEPVFATQSTNYIIPSDVQGAGGGDDARSTNYVLKDTIGEPNIGSASTTNYQLNAGYRQTLEAFISISGPSSLNIGTIVGTGQQTASGTYVVTTDAQAGYSLSWTATGTTMNSGANTIAAYSPAVANTPENWSVLTTDSEWGARLRSDSTDTAAEWGTDGASSKWLNVATSARAIVSRTSRTAVSGSNEAVQFRAEVGNTHIQPNGTYSVGVIMTATSL